MKKLKADYKMLWALIFLIIFAGIIVSASLLQDSGSRNSFSVSIVSPAGGEAWQGNTVHTISYTISGGVPNYTVELYYTTDNGTSFTFIDYHNQTWEGTYSYPWTIPLITNETVKIKIEITDNASTSASDISENFFEIDSTPPGTIILSVVDNIKDYGSPSRDSVMLTWTAPGDDGNAGTASTYDVRYSTSAITESNWDYATSCTGVPAPKPAGSSESFTVTSLPYNRTYFFAIKAYDNVGLFSISNSPSIATLDFKYWETGMIITGTQSFSNTEIWLNGNLEIVGSLTFDRVLMKIQSPLDLRYGIHIRPNGYFYAGNSNITSYWTDPGHPYWVLVSRNVLGGKGTFSLIDSSLHYCGGKVEDISADIGLEIYSDETQIVRSTISNSWGVYIRPPSGASAECALITDSLLINNTVGIYAGSRDYSLPDIPGLPDLPELPDVSFLDQIPINLIGNTFSYNGIGVYSNGARLRLENCDFLHNTNYGAIYNNTPTDYPSNISGVIYHCRFENNTEAIKSVSSSLKLNEPYILNNTRFDWSNSEIPNSFYSTVYGLNSTIDITGGCISDNAYIYCNQSSVSDVMLTTIYSKFSILNITGATISRNNGAFYRNTTIVNHMTADSAEMDTMSVTIYHEESSISIIQANIVDNGKPFDVHYENNKYNSEYIISITYPEWYPDEELAGTTQETKVPDDATFYGPTTNPFSYDPRGTPGIAWYHTAVIYTQLSTFEFRDSVFSNNLEGIICLADLSLIMENNTIKGENTMPSPYGGTMEQGWRTTSGWIATPRITYGIISVGSPLTFRNNEMSEFILGIVSVGAEINLTGNNFTHNVICTIIAASRDIGSIPFPKILFQDFWDRIEGVNVVAGFDNNNFYANGIQIIAGFATINMNHNTISGSGVFDDIYASQVGMLLASTTVNMNDTTMSAMWVNILATEEFMFEVGGQVLNLSQYFTGDLTSALMENLTFGNSTITLTNSTLEVLFGLELENSHLEMRNCEMTTNYYPIYAIDSTIIFDNVYIHDCLGHHYGNVGELYFESCTISFKDCYINNSFTYSCNSSTVTLSSSTFRHNSAGFGAKNSQITIDDCSILSNYKGLNILDSTLTVISTEFSGNTYGVYCDNSEIYLGNENIFSYNGDAIYISGSSGKIAKNIITNSTNTGIMVLSTTGKLVIEYNTLNNNRIGINCNGCHSSVTITNNTVKRNNFQSNTHSIYCSGSSPQITNNSIYNYEIGVNCTSASSPNITGNSISDCTSGIHIDSTSAPAIMDNNIKDNYNGIFSASKKSFIVQNNTITGNIYGIQNINSEIVITGCAISGNIYGIHARLSTLYINDTVISNNSYGLYGHRSSPQVFNVSIVNNTIEEECYAEGYWSDSDQLGDPANTIGKPDGVYGFVYDFNKYISTYGYRSAGNGEIKKVEIGFRWKSKNLAENYMLIRYSLDWCETYGATNYTDSNNYSEPQTRYIDVTNDRKWSWINISQISTECSFVKVTGSAGEIWLDSIWLRITSNYGVYLMECPNPGAAEPPAPKLRNSIITGSNIDLICFNSGSGSSPVELRNCTVNTIYLYTSTLECTDFTPDFNNVTFADNISSLKTSFYLTVNVTWYNVTSGGLNNEPVNNASIIIYDKDNIPTNLSTDSNGTLYTKILALTMNKTTHPNGVLLMPHRVNASKYDIPNETKPFYVNETRYVKLVLYDSKNPLLSINPVFFNITNNPLLILTGTASDNIEIRGVEITIDDITWTRCDLTIVNSTPGNYTVAWSGTITLKEGHNTVYMMAKDFAGNNGTKTVTITLDKTPPALTITSPVPGTTNQPTLTITGTTEPDATLTINTVSVNVDENGNFSKTFNLSEGVNVFTVVASDSLGNENRKVLSIVVFDSTPPTSGIAYIKSPTNSLTGITGTANDDISGVKKVEICITRGSDGYYLTGSAWSSAETWLTANGTSAWSYSWTPEEDSVYTIKSRATDNANNVETPSPGTAFTYDKTPPTLTNIKPSNNTKTISQTITVSGETDGVSVTVNGAPVNMENGKFSTAVKIGTGKNVIIIVATDSAGNINQTTIVVKRISDEWVPPSTEWVGLLVGIIVIALIIAVLVLYKKKIKINVPWKKQGQEK